MSNNIGYPHVWDIIEEEMQERGWGLDELALRMSEHMTDEKEVVLWRAVLDFCALRDDRLVLDMSTSKALARAFGTSEEVWHNMDRIARERRAAPKG